MKLVFHNIAQFIPRIINSLIVSRLVSLLILFAEKHRVVFVLIRVYQANLLLCIMVTKYARIQPLEYIETVPIDSTKIHYIVNTVKCYRIFYRISLVNQSIT